MDTRNITELILCALTALASGLGLFLHRKDRNGKRRRDMFVYYTNQSNLLVCIYYGLLFVTGLFSANGAGAVLRTPELQLVMASCILLTHLMYALVLWPVMIKYKHKAGDARPSFGDAGRFISNMLVHYIAPILAVVEWAACAEKSELTALSGLWCVILPLLYFTYAMIRGKSGRNLENTTSAYPYFFIDAGRLPKFKLARNVLLMAAAFAVLGCAMGAIGGRI